MWKILKQMLNNTEEDLKKRMLRSIILVGEFACLFASVEIVLVMEVSAMMLTLLISMCLFMIGIFFITFKYQKYEMLLNSKQEILEVCGYQEEPADLKIPAEKMEPLKAYIPMCKEMIEGSLYEKGDTFNQISVGG